MNTVKVVTSFLTNGGKILILKRSNEVRAMKGLWAGISGRIEGDEVPLARAKKEILEEVGATDSQIELISEKEKINVSSPEYPENTWEIYPFLFRLKTGTINLNWENSEYRWILPEEIHEYDTVPSLGKVLFCLL